MAQNTEFEIDDFSVASSVDDVKDAVARYNSYQTFKKIFKQLPKTELVRRGWIKHPEDMVSLISLFEDVYLERSRSLFRKANGHNEVLSAAWLSRISKSSQLALLSGEIGPFIGLFEQDLNEIAKLSVNERVLLELPKILSERGIILVYEQALPSMKLDGVVFKSVTGNPVIGISFRYSRLDNFWFTLMHELAHVVLHMEQLETPIFDDFDSNSEELIEVQANSLAKRSFVSRDVWRNCKPKYDNSDRALVEFASSIQIHPAIIAGLLQNETGDFSRYRKFVDSVDTRDLVFNHG